MPPHYKFYVLSPVFLVFFILVAPNLTLADGLVGDSMGKIIPRSGTSLDDAHRNLKQAFPPYKFLAEKDPKSEDEISQQINRPLLQQLITKSRDDAVNGSVEKIPHEMRKNLTGFIPKNILDVVRWKVKGSADVTPRGSGPRYGDARATTVDYVVVFENEYDALYNPTLWVHELAHVKQFQDLGIPEFTVKYLSTAGALEKEAYDEEVKYIAWVAVSNARNASTPATPASSSVLRPVEPFTLVENSKTCGTFAGLFPLQASAPVGTPCWAATPQGTVFGSLIPDTPEQAPPPPPVQVSDQEGLPPGTRMQECGCWGLTPSRVMPDSRCASGNVRIEICIGLCSAGYPRYGYVCQ